MNDIENARVEQRGVAVCSAMPKSERRVKQQWKSNAMATEKLSIERR
ncbi:MAG TPA: hypothetical protein VNP02_02355 [Gammaproteobacteria bacterium]|nr:hypothetical protein [Gammaproteobacteria bacterium]